MENNQNLFRCPWSETSSLMTDYHDTEWGVPLHDDLKLFEFLVLDAFQAGLSWQIVLHKRDAMRQAFKNFNPEVLAQFNELSQQEDMEKLALCQQKMDNLHAWDLLPKVETMASRLGIDITEQMGNLSGGMKRRVLLGAALWTLLYALAVVLP